MSTFESLVFSPVEEQYYKSIYEQVHDHGVIHGDDIADIFRFSSLSEETLGYIWALTDRSTKGYLTKIELFVALRAIGIAQKSPSEQITIKLIFSQHDWGTQDLPNLSHKFIDTKNNQQKDPKNFDRRFEEDIPKMSSTSNTIPALICIQINPQFNVKISFPYKHQSGNYFETDYMIYPIEVHCTLKFLDAINTIVYRRYQDFEWLRTKMLQTSMCHLVPSLPEKKFFGNFDNSFLEYRRSKLEIFLNALLFDSQFMTTPALLVFLQADDEALNDFREVSDISYSDSAMTLFPAFGNQDKQEYSRVKVDKCVSHLQHLHQYVTKCKTTHEALLNNQHILLSTKLKFLEISLPAVTLVSDIEIQTLQTEIMAEFVKKSETETKEFSTILSALISRINEVEEVVDFFVKAQREYENIKSHITYKRTKLSDSTESLAQKQREYEALQGELDIVQSKFDTTTANFENVVVDFETLRKRELIRVLQSLSRTKFFLSKFETQWWEKVLGRVSQPKSFPKVPIDMRECLISQSEPPLVYCSMIEYESKLRGFSEQLYHPKFDNDIVIPFEFPSKIEPLIPVKLGSLTKLWFQ